MGEHGITNEERRCLQMWFRQAINKLEQEEVAQQLIRRHRQDEPSQPRHRTGISLKRARHTTGQPTHKGHSVVQTTLV